VYSVFEKGRNIRRGIYGEKGANVNFVEQLDEETFAVRTYERGVEDETFSCGTGVTAVAIAMNKTKKTTATTIKLQTPGGNLEVSFDEVDTGYKNVYLKGPAIQVFKGTWPS
jgi:diaminopimelate epimerase